MREPFDDVDVDVREGIEKELTGIA